MSGVSFTDFRNANDSSARIASLRRHFGFLLAAGTHSTRALWKGAFSN